MKIYMLWAHMDTSMSSGPEYIVLTTITEEDRRDDPDNWASIKRAAHKEREWEILSTREASIEVDETKLKTMFGTPDITKYSSREEPTGMREI